ncbi:hypothetical protein [Desertibacillus haloalkaliphilus]|uniref:hypothetical protein n=1 Tax=Desertibacillus haloalkaliphilus TaxID=1328930 RepID=UPI001C25890F|nr:hypothetical protein [Desertibacillus haloalkaliphilus]MBU8906945.1 hypothetical protein [Desertibacillus haloalkaliphilus]
MKEKPPVYMYDAKHSQKVITTGDYTISIIYVSADPLTRMFSSLLGTKQRFGGITYLSIQYNSSSKEKVQQLLSDFKTKTPEDPWRITKHPRFQFAILLQVINKWKWHNVKTEKGGN